MTATAPALERLLGPHAQEFASAWGSSPVLIRRAERGGDDFSDLFGLDAVDELIADRGLRTPFFRMASRGETLPASAYTIGGGVGAGIDDQISDDLVRRRFAEGATIVLQGLHRTWQPIIEFTGRLGADLGHPVQVNAYITPAANRGFDDHYDIHDVFVLQVHGTKRWIIHDPVFAHPLRHQPWDRRADDVRAAAEQPPTLEATLEPGDCLYLPRGVIHSAEAQGETSAHLTLGVHTWAGMHLAEALLDEARTRLADDPSIRASLPLGVEVGRADAVATDVARVREALIAALHQVDAAAVATALQAQHRASQRASSVPPLAQLAAADALTADSPLVLRAGVAPTLETPGERRFVVRSRAGRFPLPEQARPAVERLCAGQTVRAADLADDPGEAVRLARTLLVEGVAVPA